MDSRIRGRIALEARELGATYERLGEAMGVSRSRACQIVAKALRLRQAERERKQTQSQDPMPPPDVPLTKYGYLNPTSDPWPPWAMDERVERARIRAQLKRHQPTL